MCAAVAPVTQTAFDARPAVSAQDLSATAAAAVAAQRVTTHVLAAAVADVTLVNVCNRQQGVFSSVVIAIENTVCILDADAQLYTCTSTVGLMYMYSCAGVINA